jgi:hypothetical protein
MPGNFAIIKIAQGAYECLATNEEGINQVSIELQLYSKFPLIVKPRIAKPAKNSHKSNELLFLQ